MLNNSENFGGFRQPDAENLQVLILSILLFWSLTLAGRGLLGEKAPLPVLALAALTVIYFFFVIFSLLLPGFSVYFPIIPMVGLVVASFIRIPFKVFIRDTGQTAAALLILSPLIWLAIVVNQATWDDYSHWLVSAHYLLHEGHLPLAEMPVLNHGSPSYPWARSMLHAWVNTYNGSISINVGSLFNVLFSGTLLLWGPFWLRQRYGVSSKSANIASMAVFSWLIVLLALCLGNNVFMSNYADTIFVICIVHLLNVLYFDFISKGPFSSARIIPDPVIIIMAISPMIIKSSGIYFVVIILGLLWLYHLASKLQQTGFQSLSQSVKKISVQACYLIPALILYFGWQLYLTNENIPASFVMRSPEFWNFHIIPKMMISIIKEMAARPYSYIGFILACIVVRRIRFNQKQDINPTLIFLIFSICFFLGTLLFQIFVYIVAFGEYEASRAASFNRYMGPAGMVIWFVLFLHLLHLLNGKTIISRLIVSGLALFGFLLVVIAFNGKLAPAQRFSNSVILTGKMLRDTITEGSKLLILDLEGNGFEPLVMRFYLDRKFFANYVSVFSYSDNVTLDMINSWSKGYDYIYIHTAPEYVKRVLMTEQRLIPIADLKITP